MSGRRYGDIRPRSPRRLVSRGRERESGESRRFSHSLRFTGRVRTVLDRSRSLVSSRDEQQRGGGGGRALSSSAREEIGGSWRISVSNGSESERISEIGGRYRGECYERRDNEGRHEHLQNLSKFSESLSQRESTLKRFRWDSLLEDKHTNINTNADRNMHSPKISGFSDLDVVPVSMKMDNGGSRAYTSLWMDPNRSRNHGLNDSVFQPPREIFEIDRENLGLLPTQFSQENSRNVQRRSSIVDSIVDKIEGNDARMGHYVIKGMDLDNETSFREQYPDVNNGNASHSMEEEGFRSGHLVGMEVGLCPQKRTHLEQRHLDRDNGPDGIGSFGEVLRRLPTSHEEFYGTERIPREVFSSEEMGIHNSFGDGSDDTGPADSLGDGLRVPAMSREEFYATERRPREVFLSEMDSYDSSEGMLKRKWLLDQELSEANQRSNLAWDDSDDIHDNSYDDQDWGHDHIEQLPLLQSTGLRPNGRSGWTIDGLMSNESAYYGDSLSSPNFPVPFRSHSSKSIKISEGHAEDWPSKGGIRNRLGPALNVKKRLGWPKPNVKQRLGPAPNVKDRLGSHKELPWIRKREEIDQQKKKGKQKERYHKDIDGSPDVPGAASSELKKNKNLKGEPPEDSEEFMQLMHSAFLKFSKTLNENSAIRRKYMGQGRIGALKCIVCGSCSKEFVDTLSLAQHAFWSCKIGSRSEHLGFHKAVCVLMGWNSEATNGQWVRHILSDSEASSLREDLILWPPVVIIHNSSISNDDPDERKIVSIEGLRVILEGMGFGQRMTHICRGKAANHSTMVVIFNSTFSGLEEAKRLHRNYAESKRGRAEFQNCSSSHGKIGVGANKLESVLFGYLGIAGDLDKLDFETKKRCVVKSKKEIEAVAHFSLKTV